MTSASQTGSGRCSALGGFAGRTSETSRARRAGRSSLAGIVLASLAMLAVALPAAADNPETCLFGLYSYGGLFASDGGEGITRVWTSEAECAWTAVSNDPSWITVTAGANGMGVDTVEFDVAPNGGPPRVGTISIAGYLYFVHQDGVTCSYSLDQSEFDATAEGGAGSVAVNATGFACGWSAVSNAGDWLTITGGDVGVGAGTVEFSVAPNSGDARSGTLTIAGQTFTVNQAAVPCTFELDGGSAQVPASGGDGEIAVTTNLGSCEWQATSSAPEWLSVTSGASGSGDGSVQWTAAPNPGEARTATLDIGGVMYTVDQDVAECALTVSPLHFSVEGKGATRTVQVTSNVSTCPWTAVSNDPDWLSIASGESGEGSGTVDVTAAPGEGSSRAGTLEIAGQIVAVSQVADPFDMMIPVAANTDGVGGSRWQTDVDLLNLGVDDAMVELSLLRANQANPIPSTKDVVVPAGGTTRLSNVLGSLFSAGNAAIGVKLLSGGADVNARFYNTASECGGTYGMMVPTSVPSSAVFDGSPAYFHLLTHSADPLVGFRVNVGFANATDVETVVMIDLYAGDGTLLKTVTQTLEAYEHHQITTVFRTPPATASVAAGYAVVRTDTEGGMVYAYAMVIDNVSGDPVYVRPVRSAPAPAEGSFDVALTAAANTGGDNGTRWQTDVDLFNPAASPATVRLSLLRANQANTDPGTADFTVEPGMTLRLSNLLGSTFSASNAAIGVEMLEGWAEVSSRFYNTASACGGTFGMFIPGEGDDEAVAAGQTGYFHHLSFSRDGTKGFRVNIGFMNDTDLETAVEIRLYGDDGSLLKTVTATLLPYEHRQFTRIHRDPAPLTPDVTHGSATVTVTTPGGRVHTYAMLIDNVSGDPVYIEPTVVATPPVETELVPLGIGAR